MRASTTSAGQRPFLKWVGGKRQLLKEIDHLVPPRFGTYHEPFVGGGAVFFHLHADGRIRKARLSDTNQRLVRTYIGVRDHVDEVISLLREHDRLHGELGKAHFLAVRSKEIDSRTNAEVAAWLIYLNKTAYNGLYRVNSKNQFNVPFGRYVRPDICPAATLRACSRALQEVDISSLGYETVREYAQPGDFVYFDPPYAPVSATADFTSYTKEGFGPSDQLNLRDLARELKRRRVSVLLSNSASKPVQELYRGFGFNVQKVSATRMVNSNAKKRGRVPELLIT